MEKAYCPSCGEEIKSFSLSVMELFRKVDNSSESDLSVISALLGGEVEFDDDAIKECFEMRDFFNAEENVVEMFESLRDKHNDRIMKAVCSGFYLDYDRDAENLEEEIRENDSCKKYYFCMKLVDMLSEQARIGNCILRLLLSSDNIDDNSDWFNIDLSECITEAKIQDTVNALIPLNGADNFELNESLRAAENICDFLNYVKVCRCNFGKVKNANYIEEKGYIIDFSVGGKRVYSRICSNCGAHIPTCLGIYPQKIISFIGTASSGKSTMINAIYKALNPDNDSRIKGIECSSDRRDPYFDYYNSAFKNAEKMIAVNKTQHNDFPALTVILSSKQENAPKYIYTFVDIPGELFGVTTEGKVNSFSRVRIMQHSDIIYLTVAGEQILGKTFDDVALALQAAFDAKTIKTFKNSLADFKINIMAAENRKIPVFLLITKSDVLNPSEGDYSPVEPFKWLYKGKDTGINKVTIDTLYNNLSGIPDFEKETAFVKNAKELLSLQTVTHIFLSKYNISDIKAILSSLTDNEWNEVPVFLTSAFGFYALSSIWNLPQKPLTEALQNLNVDGLSDEEKNSYIDTIVNCIVNGNYDEMTDQIPDNTDDVTEVIKAQKALNWTKTYIKRTISEYYKDLQGNISTYGINSFLAWMFILTGLMDYLYDESASDDYKLYHIKDNASKEARERFKCLKLTNGLLDFTYYHDFESVDTLALKVKDKAEKVKNKVMDELASKYGVANNEKELEKVLSKKKFLRFEENKMKQRDWERLKTAHEELVKAQRRLRKNDDTD